MLERRSWGFALLGTGDSAGVNFCIERQAGSSWLCVLIFKIPTPQSANRVESNRIGNGTLSSFFLSFWHQDHNHRIQTQLRN